MKKRQLTILILSFFVVLAACTTQGSKVQAGPGQVKKMAITGEIAKGYNDNGYISKLFTDNFEDFFRSSYIFFASCISNYIFHSGNITII